MSFSRFFERLKSPSDKIKDRTSIVFYIAIGAILVATPWDRFIVVPSNTVLQNSLQRIPIGLGEAMIIAQILILLVDSKTKKKLLSDFAQNVSAHIIGRWLPPELRSHLEAYLGADILRKNWTIHYDIESLPDHPHYFRLRTISDSEVENRGNSDRKYPYRYEVEESFYPELGNTRIVSCSAHVESRSGQYDIDPKDYERFEYFIGGEVPLTMENNSHVVTHNLTMPSGCTYRFKSESEEYFRDGSSIPYFTMCPVLSTQLIVNYAKASLKVFVDLSFGDVEKDTTHEETDWGDKWIFKKPILPGQGFSVRVYDKKNVQERASTRSRERKRKNPGAKAAKG
ncbi:MAG: hypothetical protein ABR907_12710 [Terracidiphilus sp.]|jgi:hypothetical protein